MRFVILGAGGLGSVIGGFLAKAGEDVTLIGRQAHVDAINRSGLRITGIRGEHLIRERLTAVTHPDQAQGEFDYLILLTKAKGSEVAMNDAKGLVQRCKAVLSLQNGIGKEETLRKWAGRDKVIGASTIEGGVLEGPGHAMNGLTTPVTGYFGELDGGTSPRTIALAEAFTRAGLVSKAVDDINQVLWEKLMQIGTASGWSVSTLGLRLYFPDGLEVREGAENYIALARDFLKVYKGMGYTPQNYYAPMGQFKEFDELPFDKAVEVMQGVGRHFRARAKESGVEGRTSMHEDLARGRKTEVDIILKPYIDKAKELGIEVPVLTTVYRIVKTQDAYLAP
jgi:2-dehydropantoate 2-reductase